MQSNTLSHLSRSVRQTRCFRFLFRVVTQRTIHKPFTQYVVRSESKRAKRFFRFLHLEIPQLSHLPDRFIRAVLLRAVSSVG